jgi:tRNA U34 5-methylaminomethyl-2-thiouridine-forming methyltransferase MnmC
MSLSAVDGVQLILTADGSHSLLNTSLNETYHSRHGAVQESQYVFIQQGLSVFIEKSNAQQVSILEVGFGTGLNAWLTLQTAQQQALRIHYTSLETRPLPAPVWQALNYTPTKVDATIFAALHTAPWDEIASVTPNFSLHKMECALQDAALEQKKFNLVYFDAFAPNKQPELWAVDALKKTVDALLPGGIFVTYCAKGQVKRDLKSLGLHVETLAGPPGKREMVRATKAM